MTSVASSRTAGCALPASWSASFGFFERFGVGTGGSGGANKAKVHGHAAIPWERVVRVGSEIVIRD